MVVVDPDLYDAYVATFGEPGSSRMFTDSVQICSSTVNEKDVKQIIEHSITFPTLEERKRYDDHGIAVIHLPYIYSGMSVMNASLIHMIFKFLKN